MICLVKLKLVTHACRQSTRTFEYDLTRITVKINKLKNYMYTRNKWNSQQIPININHKAISTSNYSCQYIVPFHRLLFFTYHDTMWHIILHYLVSNSYLLNYINRNTTTSTQIKSLSATFKSTKVVDSSFKQNCS